MADADEWLKLPPEEKCVHKQWKARVAGYDEAIKLFNTLDEKSPEFTKYLGVLKHIATDNNALAQEKGLDAILAFVENASVAGRSVGETMTAVCAKCLNSPRAKTKEKALEIILMYIEIDKNQPVQEELIKGLGNKQPKIVWGCINAFRVALEQFGPGVIQVKPLVKVLPKLLEDRDKNVREETKLLVIEVYKWIGNAIKPQLANLKPVQLQELETEFGNVPPGRPTQTRFMRSQQDLKAKAEAQAESAGGADGGSDDDGGAAVVEIDPLDLVDPVEILSKLPKNFYEQIEAKKWQERKEMLEAVEKLVTNPKLQHGDYGDLVRALKKVVSKDTNVMLVALSATCLCGLAKGLRKKFQPYAVQCVEAILVKFKEKKPMVVNALREAIDAIYPATNLEAITENLLEALADKNPNVKTESASFIGRCFTKCTTTTLSKKILKPLVAPLVKTINDTAPEVRDASFIALGTAMKVVSEKVMSALMGEIDPLKMTRIKECCENAEVVGAKGKPVTAKPINKKEPPKPAAPSKASAKPSTAKPSAKAAAGTKKVTKKAASGKAVAADKPTTEPILGDETVVEKANALLGEDNVKKLADTNWKERLAAMETIEQEIKRTPKEDMPSQAIARIVGSVKPGLKDTNFQVLKLRLSALAYLAENFSFSWTSAECLLSDLIDKIGDIKNGQGCKDVLTAISESTSFSQVASEVMRLAFVGKNPKNQTESLNWLSQAIFDFGFKVNIKSLIANLKKALGATNPAVRQSAITLLGVCYMYMGAQLRTLFEDEKAALLAQIDAEFEKVKGQRPPAPVRGMKASEAAGTEDVEEEEEAPAEDLIPRTDISDKITDALLEKLADKSWKIRKEGLEEVKAILSEAKFITANIGGLAEALKLRLADANKILVNTSLDILTTIATATGPSCKRHIPVISAALLNALSDSKPMVRKMVVGCLDAWVEQTKLNPFVEDGCFAESLKMDSPYLKSALLTWLSDKLKSNQKKLPAELKDCLPSLLLCLNDRNADVRKSAQEAVLPFMIHTGYESMLKAASKLDKSTKDGVLQLLEKSKADLPAKPVKVKSTPVVQAHISVSAAQNIMEDATDPEPASEPASAKPTRKSVAPKGKGKTTVKARSSSASRKDSAPEDTTPIMTNTYTKQQRLKDEKSLKALKWNFTTPRQEYVDQLRDQLEKNFSSSILELLVHKDFQKHIKAIQMLHSTLNQTRAETIANLDLILRWFTLKFFETNPSMLNKALEYLLALFTMLKEEDYVLSDNEANSFVPYLILKVGEPKDHVRREVRKILYALGLIYPVSKIFMFVMGGLASKNSKQRTECLEELGCQMEAYGISVCQPSPKEAIREIAKQIADRDNSVRSAALNTIVVAHQTMGDQVYKMVGRLNDKDLGMLEERIKRASRSKPVPQSMMATPGTTDKSRPSTAPQPGAADSGPAPGTVTKARPSTAQVRQISHAPPPAEDVRLPEEYRITTDWRPDLSMPELPDINYELVDELIAKPIDMPRRTQTAMGRYLTMEADINQSGDNHRLINFYMEHMTDSHPQISSNAIRALESAIKNDTASFLPQAERIMTQCIAQMKQLLVNRYSFHGDQSVMYENQTLIDGLLIQMAEKNLLVEISAHTFKELLYRSITNILAFEETEQGSDAIQKLSYMLAAALDKGNKTNALVAALRHMQDIVYMSRRPLSNETFPEKFLDLSLKCAYRCIRGCNNHVSDLLTDPVVDECNSFHTNFPKSYWETGDDMPRKTVRTIVALLAQHTPNKFMASMQRASFRPCSEFESAARKFLQKNGHRLASRAGSENDLSRLNKTMSGHLEKVSLAGIFTKISKTETREEGLMELYLYKEKFPQSDIEPFMKNTSSEFRAFLNDSLLKIANKQRDKVNKPNGTQGSAEHPVEYWEDKIRKLDETVSKLGLNKANTNRSTTSGAGDATSARLDGETDTHAAPSAPPDVVLSTAGGAGIFNKENYPADPQRRPQADVDDSINQLLELKARLDRIKQRNAAPSDSS